tara:strand:+ start:278 stop:883 length:606 start_codon:yes stop_codon:yes gene_type:complete
MPGKIGLGLGGTIMSSSSPAVTIDDYLWDLVSAHNLQPLESGTVSDFHDSWDLDGVDYMPEVSPDDEGYWDDYTDLVTNGTFVTDSNWDKGTNWTINDVKAGKAHNTGSANFSDLTQTNSNVEAGNDYEVTYTISNFGGGEVKFIMNNNSAAGAARTADGTYTDIIKALTGSYSFRTGSSGFIGSIDNVTVKEYAISPLDV